MAWREEKGDRGVRTGPPLKRFGLDGGKAPHHCRGAGHRRTEMTDRSCHCHGRQPLRYCTCTKIPPFSLIGAVARRVTVCDVTPRSTVYCSAPCCPLICPDGRGLDSRSSRHRKGGKRRGDTRHVLWLAHALLLVFAAAHGKLPRALNLASGRDAKGALVAVHVLVNWRHATHLRRHAPDMLHIWGETASCWSLS